MSTETEIPFQGRRLRFDSAQSFDDLVGALLADVGHEPVQIDDIAVRFDTWESYEREVQSRVGASGFMLFAPVELLITEEPNDRSALTYAVPSSLMVIEPNEPLRNAALELDAKLAALANSVTTP